MPTFLFNEIVFGPVRSRRLGVSLGINLLPTDRKFCNYDCLYCECGWSHMKKVTSRDLPSREKTSEALISKLKEMASAGVPPDVITFAGNGEPTMHPSFREIMADTVRIRDEYCPSARIAVLCNSTLIHRKNVAEALMSADQSILKLDTVIEETFDNLNKPSRGITISGIISNLTGFKAEKILQTMFVRGEYNGKYIDNTTETELSGLIDAYRKIKPALIMIYTYERATAAENLTRVSPGELDAIGRRLENEGFMVEVSY